MNYVSLVHPSLHLDLMVEQEFYPQLVSYIQRMDCTYTEERELRPIRGHKYRVLKDIRGKNGAGLGELLGLFYSLEWGALTDRGEQARKFYIMVNPRRKEKRKHAGKHRKEADQGSHSGNSGEPAGYSEPGPVGGSAGNGADAGVTGADDLWESPRVG